MDWGDECISKSPDLAYFAMRIKLTPTDPLSGLSDAVVSQLPTAETMIEKAAIKTHKGPAVCGGQPGDPGESAAFVAPMAFQGDSPKMTKMREYPIECTTKKCDSTLQHNLQPQISITRKKSKFC